MDIPKIDLSTLPGLETATGMFGALRQSVSGIDDTIVAIMVYVYDVAPPPPPSAFF